jgi:Ni2+-binding GTPase involved in maturation of urease and hydrogenase
LNAFKKPIAQCSDAVVIGVTRTELSPDVNFLDRFHERLCALKLNIPVFEVDGRKREDVKQMLLALLALLPQYQQD